MTKLTKSLLVIKERNCTVSLVLDRRTNRTNAAEYPLSLRFTVDRKSFYHNVGGSYTEKKFSDICNASKSASENYKEQRIWKDNIVAKYERLISNLNTGGNLTFQMVHSAVKTGNIYGLTTEDSSFIKVWEDIVYDLKTNDNGKRYTTGESYECALKSFRRIMGVNAIKGFDISVAEIQKWREGMKNGIIENGKIVGKISDTTAGIYLRACRAVWNTCLRKGYLSDVIYPFSNKKEKGLVCIPTSSRRRKNYLRVSQMTELYQLFLSKKYPKSWGKQYIEKAHYSLGLFLVQYLCNGFNLADAARLKYDDYYYQCDSKAFRFNRKKTERTSNDGSEVIIPIIDPLQKVLDEIAAPPKRNDYVFPEIFNGAENEMERRKRTSQENSNVQDRVTRICHEVLHWDESIRPSGTWCRHSFATNLRNAGVEMEYITESMGHSTGEHSITKIYLDNYPLERQMEYNSKLLNIRRKNSVKDKLIVELSRMSEKEIRLIYNNIINV